MKADAVIKSEGMKILSEHLGIVDAERFIFLINSQGFDYTEWQRDLFGDMPLEELCDKAMDHWRKTHSET